MKAADYTLSACFHADSLPFGAPEHAAKAWGVLRREPLAHRGRDAATICATGINCPPCAPL